MPRPWAMPNNIKAITAKMYKRMYKRWKFMNVIIPTLYDSAVAGDSFL